MKIQVVDTTDRKAEGPAEVDLAVSQGETAETTGISTRTPAAVGHGSGREVGHRLPGVGRILAREVQEVLSVAGAGTLHAEV